MESEQADSNLNHSDIRDVNGHATRGNNSKMNEQGGIQTHFSRLFWIGRGPSHDRLDIHHAFCPVPLNIFLNLSSISHNFILNAKK
jgi:hypothetical protein